MREREFDRNEALNKAMNLFWQRGYFDTSVQDLVEHTGVARSGLYGEFGDKKELFLTALDQYHNTVAHDALGKLTRPGAGIKELKSFFAGVVRSAGSNTPHPGCLICNTAIEFGRTDTDVNDKIKQHFNGLRKYFRRAAENAIQQGKLDRKFDAPAYGDFLMGVMQGACVLARSPVDRAVIGRYVRTALSQLD